MIFLHLTHIHSPLFHLSRPYPFHSYQSISIIFIPMPELKTRAVQIKKRRIFVWISPGNWIEYFGKIKKIISPKWQFQPHVRVKSAIFMVSYQYSKKMVSRAREENPWNEYVGERNYKKIDKYKWRLMNFNELWWINLNFVTFVTITSFHSSSKSESMFFLL